MTTLKMLHQKWSKDPAYVEAYDALEEEFALAAAFFQARTRAGLTQDEVVLRVHHAKHDCPTRSWPERAV